MVWCATRNSNIAPFLNVIQQNQMSFPQHNQMNLLQNNQMSFPQQSQVRDVGAAFLPVLLKSTALMTTGAYFELNLERSANLLIIAVLTGTRVVVIAHVVCNVTSLPKEADLIVRSVKNVPCCCSRLTMDIVDLSRVHIGQCIANRSSQ